ncbi:MAG TPA: tRNA lysidine(34) synthetase TilS [Phycisphaerales bacterium]|nr:tRNA lysidine(34) synthetase TilS [Phycisphaerales bacterium]
MEGGEAKRSRDEAVRAWRELTGGPEVRDHARPTLVAISGGADSSALLISLASAEGAKIVAAYIGHGLRSADEDRADVEAVTSLCERLGVPMIERHIRVDRSENLESSAREERYRALEQIAVSQGCRYVATGHHSGDQLETMLMALTRGAGLAGLVGMVPSRDLGQGVRLIRPMLGLDRVACEQICNAYGYGPRHDPTNDDLSRRRAWLRAVVAPIIENTPGLGSRLSTTSRLLRDAQEVVAMRVEALVDRAEVSPGSVSIPVGLLEGETGLVVGGVLRRLACTISPEGSDQRGWKHLRPIIAAIQSGDGLERRFDLCGMSVHVVDKHIVIRRSPIAKEL